MCFSKLLFVVICLASQCFVIATSRNALIELAAQEKRRRTAILNKVPLYRNEDLIRLEGSRVSEIGSTAKGRELSAVPVETRNQAKAIEKDPEEIWLNKIQAARERLSAVVNRLHVLQLRHNYLRNLYLNAADELQRTRLEAELKDLMAQLKRGEVEEREAREAWLETRALARKSGIEAGAEPEKVVEIEH